jgi:hypothetical protein
MHDAIIQNLIEDLAWWEGLIDHTVVSDAAAQCCSKPETSSWNMNWNVMVTSWTTTTAVSLRPGIRHEHFD